MTCRQAGIRGVSTFVQKHLLKRYGLEISPAIQIGGGLYIAHPVGCVLFAESIGSNLTMIGQATFGTRDDGRWPVIEDEVFVGVGARVIGGVRVGAGARIGANAVVLADVPAGATVVGVPGRILTRDSTLG